MIARRVWNRLTSQSRAAIPPSGSDKKSRALLLTTSPPGAWAGSSLRAGITASVLRGHFDHLDTISLSLPSDEALASDDLRLIPRPPAASRWRFLAAAARDGSAFVVEHQLGLRRLVRDMSTAGRPANGYDLVWAHFALMARAGLAVPATARVLDVDLSWGADARRWAEHASGSRAQNAYWRADAKAVTRAERRHARRYDRLVVASELEAQRLGVEGAEIDVVPNAVVEPEFLPPPASQRSRLLFVGTLDYGANVEAVRYLVRAILPALRRRRPEAVVSIVGRNPIPEIVRLCAEAGVELTPDAPSLEPHYGDARAVLAPLRLGGGTRMKLLEAMARGLPVVATSIGAEGVELRHGEDALLADDPEGFAEECVRLVDDAALADRLGAAGREVWERRHRPEVASKEIWTLLEEVRARRA